MFKANPQLQARCISQSVLKVCALQWFGMCLPVKACLQPFPSPSWIFFQLPSSLCLLLLFSSSSSLTEMISDTGTLWHIPGHGHRQAHTVRQLHVRHFERWSTSRLTLGSFFKRWDAAISKFYFKNWNDVRWFLSLSEYINTTISTCTH